MKQIKGGVCAPQGFLAGGIHAGLRKNPEKKDLALIYSTVPCVAAGATTQNLVVAAPVTVTREHLKNASAQAILCNSGNANACTSSGMSVATQMAALAGKALGISTQQVLVGSTGVIGQEMPIAPVESAITPLVESLSTEGSDACARAIMTTDTMKKEIAVSFTLDEKEVRIGGISKGSGMIHPNMATMLGFITTDVAIQPELLQKAVMDATDKTFNMISVDGDTSTNDMVLVLANGLAENAVITTEDENYKVFYKALREVFQTLAVAIAADGEGASKLLISKVAGAETTQAAQQLAKSVITSSLTKAAMFGEDANWGRVLCALGYSGILIDVQKISIQFSSAKGQVVVAEKGQSVPFDEVIAAAVLSADEITINTTVGEGKYSATAWGCDLTYEYVKINGEYRS